MQTRQGIVLVATSSVGCRSKTKWTRGEGRGSKNTSFTFEGNISEEIRDLTTNDIGQKLETLGRYQKNYADIGDIW